jgi:tight adherence protein B
MNWTIIIVAVAAILLSGVTLAIAVGRRQEQRNRVLAVITRGKSASAPKDDREKQLAKQRADIAQKLKDAGKDGEKKKDKTTIRELMIQAGIEAPVSRYWIGSAIFAVVVWIAAALLTSWPQIAVVFVTFTAFFGMPRFFLKWKAARRQKQFLEELPDALDGCVRLLQAGMPISEAIAMVSREFEGPLKDEMQKIYDNQKIGIPLGQAALETAHRVPLTEAHMFATALQIQSETGSSLSEVLTNLSGVIRARFRLKRKVQALSSEAKASAAIIAALPFLVATGLYLVNPKYMDPLFNTAKGHVMLGGALFWMLCGVLIMRQMINFRI